MIEKNSEFNYTLVCKITIMIQNIGIKHLRAHCLLGNVAITDHDLKTASVLKVKTWKQK